MNQNIRERIMELSDQYEDSVLVLRREIHADPELSFKETRTAQRVKVALESLGLTVRSGIAGTGLIADMHGRAPGKTLLLRADMDALPLQEENDLPFCSKNPGVMHACGHDVHTANLVGVAKILKDLCGEWDGTVRFVFQPAEENGGGGREMIRAGIMDDIKIDASMALHTLTTLEPGRFSLGWKNVTSYSDRFSITVHGKKTHSAQPQNGVDAINIAAQIIVAVNGLLAKNIDPMARATYSFGTINGGTAPNIIPDCVEMVGMMRNVTDETREILRDKIQSVAEGIAAAMGGRAEYNFFEGYASVYNHPIIADFVAAEIEANAAQWVSDIDPQASESGDLLVRETEPILGAEDYGFYTQRVPSCFYRVATGDAAPAHSPKFMVEEKYIKLCTRSMASLAISYLMD
ncbi:MAG TPA: M20 family metallopeptidase [Clostridia bacterium]|nr:M20 family metallopeptidase [Clostridia bacterium]